MKRNMGIADRAIRIVLAVVVGVLYFSHQLTGTAAIVLGIVAAVFLATGIVGTCPLYLPLHLSTRLADRRKSSS
jgi:glucose uptake protein GlcU